MELEVRAIQREELPAFMRTMGYGFGWDPLPDPDPHFEAITELDRTRCVFDGSTLVATSGAYSLDLNVPGGSLLTGGTTYVSVRSSHRRRGLLRAIMTAHLQDVRERNEPLAALWASESSIYGRFGYGWAAQQCSYEIDRAWSAFAEPLAPQGRFRLVDPDEAGKILPRVYERSSRGRPGSFARSEGWWEHRRLFDAPWERSGASAFRYAVYERDGDPQGYVQYRVRNPPSEDGLAHARLYVVELQGVDAAARAALWRYTLDIDLVEKIRAWNQPPDDPLPWLLADPRRLQTTVRDSLWLRVMDVARALESRAYSASGRLVLEIHDDFCPWNAGTYALEGSPDGAKCGASGETPDLRMRASDLAALYLGGHRFQTLGRAGRIEGSAEMLRRADAMFAWDLLPWCPEIF